MSTKDMVQTMSVCPILTNFFKRKENAPFHKYKKRELGLRAPSMEQPNISSDKPKTGENEENTHTCCELRTSVSLVSRNMDDSVYSHTTPIVTVLSKSNLLSLLLVRNGCRCTPIRSQFCPGFPVTTVIGLDY